MSGERLLARKAGAASSYFNEFVVFGIGCEKTFPTKTYCETTDQPIMDQKRRFERIRPQGRVASVAKIFIGPKVPVIECLLVDYSAGGACIQLQKHVDLPPRFELLYGTTRKRCRPVWKRGLRMGLVF